MRSLLVTIGLVVATFVAVVVEFFLPPVATLMGARIMLVPVLFCYGACTLPYVSMLVLAIACGLMGDLAHIQVIGETVEIGLGWSILVYVAIGSICQGLRPLVVRGHWEIHAAMSALTTWVLLGSQFLMLSLRRFEQGGFIYNEIVAWRILGPGVIALLLSPAVYFLMSFVPRDVPRVQRLRGFQR